MGWLDVFRWQNSKRFPKRKKTRYEQDLDRDPPRIPDKCSICGQKILGRAWRIDDRRWSCTGCANESG